MIEHENSEAKPEAELIEQVFSFLRQHSDAFNGSSHVFGKYFVGNYCAPENTPVSSWLLIRSCGVKWY